MIIIVECVQGGISANRLKERKQKHTRTKITGTAIRNSNNKASLWYVGFFGGKHAATKYEKKVSQLLYVVV